MQTFPKPYSNNKNKLITHARYRTLCLVLCAPCSVSAIERPSSGRLFEQMSPTVYFVWTRSRSSTYHCRGSVSTPAKTAAIQWFGRTKCVSRSNFVDLKGNAHSQTPFVFFHSPVFSTRLICTMFTVQQFFLSLSFRLDNSCADTSFRIRCGSCFAHVVWYFHYASPSVVCAESDLNIFYFPSAKSKTKTQPSATVHQYMYALCLCAKVCMDLVRRGSRFFFIFAFLCKVNAVLFRFTEGDRICFLLFSPSATAICMAFVCVCVGIYSRCFR